MVRKACGVNQMKVYSVYEVNGSGHGDTEFNQIAIAKTEDVAKRFIADFIVVGFKPDGTAHPSMNESNNWTYFGSRYDDSVNSIIGYNQSGGFIVEETEVIE